MVVEVTEGSGSRTPSCAARATTEKKEYRESLEKYAMSYFVAPKLDRYERGTSPTSAIVPLTL